MKLLTKLTPLLIALTLSVSANANDKADSLHSVGLEFAGGGIDYKGKDTDGTGVGQSYLYYNYQFSPHYYLEVGLLNAEDIDEWDCENTGSPGWDCEYDGNNSYSLEVDNFKQDSLILALKTDLSLSKRNSLYAKVGAEIYEYEMSVGHHKRADESGVGFFVEAGWQYRWDNGIGLNAGVQHHDLGDLERTNVNFGVSYAF